MDQLGDGRECGVAQAEALQHYLEAAAVALVGELGLEHVEAQLSRHRRVGLAGDEFELGLGVDEPPDQPGAGDAIDVDALARDPAPALERIRGRGRRRLRHG